VNTPATRISFWKAQPASQSRPRRILVVTSDEPDAHRVIDQLLLNPRPVCRQVAEPASLLRALEEIRWDAVVLDTRRAGSHPLLALKTIRHYAPEVPVFALLERRGGDAGKVWAANGVADMVGWDRLGDLRSLVETRLKELARAAPVEDTPPVAPLDQSTETRFQNLADNIPECFWLYDVSSQRVVYANPAFHNLFGPTDDDPQGWYRLVHPEDAARLVESAERTRFGGLNEDLRILRSDGEERWVQVRTFAVRDDEGVVRSVGGMARDITDAVAQQLELYNLSRFDRVTELPNRVLFQERLAAALALARRNAWRLAVLFIDLDRFKQVNDTLGYRVGDELLHVMATRLRCCLRDSDTVGRLGGDEFAVILPDLESAELAAVVARKIIDAVGQSCHIEGEELFVSASIGITMFPDDADDSESLVRNADAAMYLAKEAGRSTYAFYTPEMNARARARMAMENDLRRALARSEFVLHYQPKICCRTGGVLGVEALLRWQNPERGTVGPADFIPLLEETGLIVPVGEWVLNSACAQARAWHDMGFSHLTVAVNLSGRQIESWDVVAGVDAALAQSGLPATALELELTESILMEDEEAVVAILGALKRKGVQVAVDDFGTGYSSLSYLKRFPIDSLKVDRSFVQDITADSGDASITRAVIHMGHELALKVIAEGVETAGQLQLLVAAGCDQIQGYYFSRPLPVAEITRLFHERPGLDLGSCCLTPSDAVPPDVRYQEILRDFTATQARLVVAETERDRYRAQCEAGWHLWSRAMDNVRDPLIGLAEDGLVAFANHAAERELGACGLLPGCAAADVLPGSLMAAIRSGAVTDRPLILNGDRYLVTATPLAVGAASGNVLLHFLRSDGGAP